MASTASQNPSPATKLSPQQQRLLLAALNSNKPTGNALPSLSPEAFNMNPLSFPDTTLQDPGSGSLGLEESPFVDYDFDFDPDASYDFDYPAADTGDDMIGALPGDPSNGDVETHDKRRHTDDADDETGGGKRREGEEKPAAKKPGRKPLMTEPTSKRKAQNRAAQRAFRERKEKHLKDLEDKVQDLEKASETANHENSILRAQIEKMTIELREYKKRLAMTAAGGPRVGMVNAQANRVGLINSPNDISFSFDFPKFGQLPGPPVLADKLSRTNSGSPGEKSVSPLTKASSVSSISGSKATPTAADTDFDIATFSGLFTPQTDPMGQDNFDYMPQHKGSTASRATDSSVSFSTSGHNTSYNSPTSSSNSNGGPSSSCGTSPEPTNHSPSAGKPLDSTLGTIGEECGNKSEGELTFCDRLNMACGNPNNPIPRTLSKSEASVTAQPVSFDINSLDWMSQQNGGQFDPQLFGDYREPQDTILSGNFDDSFFTEAFAVPDFTTPYAMAPSPAVAKKDLVQEIDKQIDEDEEVVPGEDSSEMLTCNKIWFVDHTNPVAPSNESRDRIQNCPKVQTGEFDLDGLCSQLQSKAKCSETGAVVNEKDFTAIMSQFDCDATSKGTQQPKKQTA